jgi:hypothetical protein
LGDDSPGDDSPGDDSPGDDDSPRPGGPAGAARKSGQIDERCGDRGLARNNEEKS